MPPPILNLSASKVLFLLFRLFPIILPSYFILSSIFSVDIKGVIYLAGLLFATISSILIANTLKPLVGSWFQDLATKRRPNPLVNGDHSRCEVITLGLGTTTSPSRLSENAPLSQVVYTFTLGYFLYIIGKYKLWDQNILAIILMGLLIIIDWGWIVFNGCNQVAEIALAFAVGAGWGVSWALIIDSSNAVKLQYFSGLSNRTVCQRPSADTYVCSNQR